MPSEPDPEKPDAPDQPEPKRPATVDDAPIPDAVASEVASPTAAPIVISTVSIAESGPVDTSSSSGSIEVALSAPKLPKSDDDGTPVEIAAHDSAPVSSGRVTQMTVAATGPTEMARKRTIAAVGGDVLGSGVSALGAGIGVVGDTVGKLGEASHKVPVVGSSITKLGEGITAVGESLHELPRVARTRRGALLVRSLIVGFVLVASWIAVIVLLQIRGTDSPDFRPHAERILTQLGQSKDKIEELYEKSSPRFQEVVRKQRFVDDMLDLKDTVGTFLEITAINESLVTSGPTGRIGRMTMMVAYTKGKTRATVSLHWIDNEWKLLGVSVEVPPELKITQTDREKRVAVCEEIEVDGKKHAIPLGPMNAKQCVFHQIANRVLEQLRDGQANQVWDDASKVFKDQEQKGRFGVIQAEYQRVLGEYRRIIRVIEGKSMGGTRAFFDVIAEYSRASVRVIFGFERISETDAWKLRSLKVALPMPRVDDVLAGSGSASPPRTPHGAGSAGSGSGSGSAGSGAAKAGAPARPPVRAPVRPPTGSGTGSGTKSDAGSAGSGSGTRSDAGSGASSAGSGSGTGAGSSMRAGSGAGNGSGTMSGTGSGSASVGSGS